MILCKGRSNQLYNPDQNVNDISCTANFYFLCLFVSLISCASLYKCYHSCLAEFENSERECEKERWSICVQFDLTAVELPFQYFCFNHFKFYTYDLSSFKNTYRFHLNIPYLKMWVITIICVISFFIAYSAAACTWSYMLNNLTKQMIFFWRKRYQNVMFNDLKTNF